MSKRCKFFAFRDLARPGRRAVGGSDGGYVVVDAMVALLMIGMTVTLSLRALDQAGRAADLAAELRTAEGLMRGLMREGDREIGVVRGEARGFAWTLQTLPTGGERPIEICRRSVALESRSTGRTFAAAALETCPAAGAAL